MAKIKGWKRLVAKNYQASHVWMNDDGDLLRIEKRKYQSKNLWYIDYRYGWKIMTVKGGKHPQEPYHTGKEAIQVAKRFMKKHPRG